MMTPEKIRRHYEAPISDCGQFRPDLVWYWRAKSMQPTRTCWQLRYRAHSRTFRLWRGRWREGVHEFETHIGDLVEVADERIVTAFRESLSSSAIAACARASILAPPRRDIIKELLE